MSEPSLLHTLIAAQGDLTAVERFATAHSGHDRHAITAEARRYSALIPLTPPEAGQQYAFEVDLDACTGCKACVTGCHNLNGLDEGEVWRTVGLLHGGSAQAPAHQTVTTACHHCLEPACMTGCPVKAYEKDPVTGIVKHLDDQCIGCQYCLFTCPYDAPKFNRERGIVRKCDMCSDRLAHAEAPACVQACPNEAIRITVVDQAQAIEAAQAASFIPGAPSPGDTLPTTLYQTARARPRNLLPADFYALNPEHSHPALVVMLVLTQLSVGAFSADYIFGTSNALFALALGLAAMGASVFHLGRPLYAFRAFLGLKTSWLSREIIGFSLFSLWATIYAGSLWLPRFFRLQPALQLAVAVTGLLAVFCSVMVYAVTQREGWRGPSTGFKFLGTTLILGLATVVMTSLVSGARSAQLPLIAKVLAAATGCKLAVELSIFRHLGRRPHTALKRSAMLMVGDLSRATLLRFSAGAIGGVALPLWVAFGHPEAAGRLLLGAIGVALFSLSLTGELSERYLFFAASTAPKMPGGPA